MTSASKLSLTTLLATAVLALALPGQAQAQLKIGVVNLAALLDQSPQAQAVVESLQDEFGPRQRDLVSRANELRELEQRFERDEAVMGDQQRRDMERQLRDTQRDLARRQNELVEDFNLRRNEELGALQNSLVREIQDYARRENYDMIVAEGVVYASSGIDITPRILETLQANFRNSGRR
ncbi:MAG: OmpH family outer membrane protein [Gammaproteobacteria bacterium]|nr:OmpH family outer membrane protein [Gammaproteobacteria bacterium]TVQ43550.1 MAG: OmpH family outer membrane protein [Gammaproteobacteria bacterium]